MKSNLTNKETLSLLIFFLILSGFWGFVGLHLLSDVNKPKIEALVKIGSLGSENIEPVEIWMLKLQSDKYIKSLIDDSQLSAPNSISKVRGDLTLQKFGRNYLLIRFKAYNYNEGISFINSLFKRIKADEEVSVKKSLNSLREKKKQLFEQAQEIEVYSRLTFSDSNLTALNPIYESATFIIEPTPRVYQDDLQKIFIYISIIGLIFLSFLGGIFAYSNLRSKLTSSQNSHPCCKDQ